MPLGPAPGVATTSTRPPAARTTVPRSMSTASTAPSPAMTGPSGNPSPSAMTSNSSGSCLRSLMRRPSGDVDAEQLEGVVAGDPPHGVAGKAGQRLGDEVGRGGGPLGVGPVRSEQQAVGPHLADQVADVVLPERRHPYVLTEDVPGTVAEVARVAVERRVGDVGVDLPAHEQPSPTADVRPPHAAVAERPVLVAGQGVLRLVVVVEVEDARLHSQIIIDVDFKNRPLKASRTRGRLARAVGQVLTVRFAMLAAQRDGAHDPEQDGRNLRTESAVLGAQ